MRRRLPILVAVIALFTIGVAVVLTGLSLALIADGIVDKANRR